MRWFKIIENGETISAEEFEFPTFLKSVDGLPVRCNEFEAEGILSLDSSEAYQLCGKDDPIPSQGKIAIEVTRSEYERVINEYYEDGETPDIPLSESNDTSEEEIEARMTIGQMREAIISLQEEVEILRNKTAIL